MLQRGVYIASERRVSAWTPRAMVYLLQHKWQNVDRLLIEGKTHKSCGSQSCRIEDMAFILHRSQSWYEMRWNPLKN